MNDKKEKYLYINTIGCQMNVYDTAKIEHHLSALGYRKTDILETADLIMVNTCSVRAKAEQKAFSFLGRLSPLKRKNPGLILGICGCLAQQEGEKILQRVPFLDFVCGTRAISRLPYMIKKIEDKKCRIVDVHMSEVIQESIHLQAPKSTAGVSAFVTIMRGCDNFCTYCVVPHVRGREQSRKPDDIINEIKSLVAVGVREVTLLGQNVNSYGQKEGLCDFSELLKMVNEIPGLLRIRFTTSHPKDLSEELIAAFGGLENLCPHIHLPVQSGSDRILKKMNRNYTKALYTEKIRRLRAVAPDIAVTSDLMVGFPGETEADFMETLDFVGTIKYDSIFAFIYSDRPMAPSARFENKIDENEKKRRLQALLGLQKQFTLEKHRAMVGSKQTVLTEGPSKRERGDASRADLLTQQWSGRTGANKIVNYQLDDDLLNGLPLNKDLTGAMVRVTITKALSHSIWGKAVWIEPDVCELKGDNSDAA